MKNNRIGAVFAEYMLALVLVALTVSTAIYLIKNAAEARAKQSAGVVITLAPCAVGAAVQSEDCK